jgi:hypothetical protein
MYDRKISSWIYIHIILQILLHLLLTLCKLKDSKLYYIKPLYLYLVYIYYLL